MNTRLFSLQGKSAEELKAFINSMNDKADEIVAEGGVWQMYNTTRIVNVYPVRVVSVFPISKSVEVRALSGKPFMVRNWEGKGKIASATTYVWPEDLFKNETAPAATETESKIKTNLAPEF